MFCQDSTLGDLVDRSLITIATGTRTGDALSLARAQHIHHLPVLDGTTLVGLVCTCDLEGAPEDSQIDEWMSQPPVALDAGASYGDAARTMSTRSVGSVIVTLEDAAYGIVTRGDLLAAAPELESQLDLTRCEVCGLTRHLQRDLAGHTHCVYCARPIEEL